MRNGAILKLILDELHDIRGDIRGLNDRVDTVNGRLDAVIDGLAALRADAHTHND